MNQRGSTINGKATQDERLQFLATVADMYYVQKQSQEIIAQQLGYSRSAISRFLTEAQEVGVVEVVVHYPIHRAYDLEQELLHRFPLEHIQVIRRAGLDFARMVRQLGRLGAIHLEQVMPANAIIGISWGMAIYEVAHSLRPRYTKGSVVVVQMMGSVGYGDPAIDGPEVARTFANALGAQYQILPAPVIVQDRKTREQLRTERQIQDVIELAAQTDIAVVGIGSVEAERSGLVRAGHLSVEEMRGLKADGAVGDICATLYDINGEILDTDVNHRVMAVSLPALAEHSHVIGVAGGAVKGPAILGALRGGFLKTLITDSSAAETILRLDNGDAA